MKEESPSFFSLVNDQRLQDVADTTFPKDHLLGWILIISPYGELRSKVEIGLESFVGDYGVKTITVMSHGFGFGLRYPSTPPPITTWSLFHDDEVFCFVEGSFYDSYHNYWPVQGKDSVLAQRLSTDYRSLGGRAVSDLSGSFCGCIIDRRTGQFATFVDRLGTKPLFWAREKDDILISSVFSSLRRLKRLKIDLTSAFQFLTVGFPIGSRTLINGVNIHPPSHLQVFHGHRHSSVRYWEPPIRRSSLTVRQSAEEIADATEDCVGRLHRVANDVLALGLTGGRDSRVILSALVRRGVPFIPLRWDEGNSNDRTARLLSDAIGINLKLAPKVASRSDVESIRDDVFVYTQCTHRYMTGFPRLGRACLQYHTPCLMLGFGGDVISGGLTTPSPHYLKTISDLAQCALNNQMEYLSFAAATDLLLDLNANDIEQAKAEWEQSFIDEAIHKDLFDVAIWQRIANRNLKRIRFSMLPLSKYTQPVFPFLDNAVLNTYFTLPVRLLRDQLAHSYASFCRITRFGNYPVSGSPLPLRIEVCLPSALQRLRAWRHRARNLMFRLTPRLTISWENEYQQMYEDISNCPLYSSNVLKRWWTKDHITPANLRHLHTLSKAYSFFQELP